MRGDGHFGVGKLLIAAALLTLPLSLPSSAHDKQPAALLLKGKAGDLYAVQPVFPILLGLEQEAGPIPIKGELLNCSTSLRVIQVVIDGKPGTIRELRLECQEGRKFVVRAIDFGGAK
jgi:hypothetical protein